MAGELDQDLQNHRDNVEQVVFDLPAGTYTVHVGHTGSLYNDSLRGQVQDFSLLVSVPRDYRGATRDAIEIEPPRDVPFGTFGGIATVNVNGRQVHQTAGGEGQFILLESFAQQGRMAFVPELADGVPADADPLKPGFQGLVTLPYTFTYANPSGGGDVVENRTITVVVGDADSQPQWTRRNDIVFDADSLLDRIRIQHRLNALEFPTAGGNALVVDGALGASSRHAIGLFNGAVDSDPDAGHVASASFTAVGQSWINADRRHDHLPRSHDGGLLRVSATQPSHRGRLDERRAVANTGQLEQPAQRVGKQSGAAGHPRPDHRRAGIQRRGVQAAVAVVSGRLAGRFLRAEDRAGVAQRSADFLR